MPKMPTRPRNTLPPLACDGHTHVFGPFDGFPLMLPSSYPPPDAPVERHLKMLDTIGAARGVIVQPAPYSTDTRLMVHALKAAKGRLRGIAIATPAIADAALRELDEAGVRGLRFVDMLDLQGNKFSGAVSARELTHLAPRMKALGWHAELWANLDDHLALLPDLIPHGIAIVLDHLACLDVSRGVGDPSFQSLLRHVRVGDVYVKLTLCRRSNQYPSYAELKPFHDALVAANPDRLLWGSDWPYVAMGDSAPDVGVMVDLVHDWVPDAAIRRKIFVDNPARVYAF
ncbi:MAG: amidohydrolase family protein [Rhizomicrobium sp.]